MGYSKIDKEFVRYNRCTKLKRKKQNVIFTCLLLAELSESEELPEPLEDDEEDPEDEDEEVVLDPDVLRLILVLTLIPGVFVVGGILLSGLIIMSQ